MGRDPLPVLVKLATRKVEEAERALHVTREEKAVIDREVARREREMFVAFRDATGDADVLAMQAVTAYRERLGREIAMLGEHKRGLEDTERAQLKVLHGLFMEQKRYELLQKQKAKRAKKEHEKKVQAALDELGQGGYG